MGKRYGKFKHKVRNKLPDRIRYATVCRKCNTPIISDRCFTCKLDQAKGWSKPY